MWTWHADTPRGAACPAKAHVSDTVQQFSSAPARFLIHAVGLHRPLPKPLPFRGQGCGRETLNEQRVSAAPLPSTLNPKP